jgi:hypothetical protein
VEVFKLRKQVISIPDNPNFETIKYKCPGVVDKLISYLPWNKEKYRVYRIRLKSVEEVSEMLIFNKNSFGIQVKENSFIIWRFTVNGIFMQRLECVLG